MSDQQAAAFAALASPHRRKLLDLLRQGPMNTGELADAFPNLSRYAVMQHLNVLESASLVLYRRRGRQRINFINPVPIQQLYERWMTPFLALPAAPMTQLEQHLTSQQEDSRVMDEPFRVVQIEAEIEIAASQDQVFSALTTGLDEWWPLRNREQARIVYEPSRGGLVYEDWGDGAGLVYGRISVYEPPHRSVLEGSGNWNPQAYLSKNIDQVEATEAGSLYKKTLLLWGSVSGETEAMFRQGTGRLLQQLKAFAEAG